MASTWSSIFQLGPTLTARAFVDVALTFVESMAIVLGVVGFIAAITIPLYAKPYENDDRSRRPFRWTPGVLKPSSARETARDTRDRSAQEDTILRLFRTRRIRSSEVRFTNGPLPRRDEPKLRGPSQSRKPQEMRRCRFWDTKRLMFESRYVALFSPDEAPIAYEVRPTPESKRAHERRE